MSHNWSVAVIENAEEIRNELYNTGLGDDINCFIYHIYLSTRFVTNNCHYKDLSQSFITEICHAKPHNWREGY